MSPWQWCDKQHHGVGKVLAKGRATSEPQQGEINRWVHMSLYHSAWLLLYPAHFGVTTNYLVSPKKRRSSVCKSRKHCNQKIEKKLSPLDKCSCVVCFRTQNKQTKFLSLCLSACLYLCLLCVPSGGIITFKGISGSKQNWVGVFYSYV